MRQTPTFQSIIILVLRSGAGLAVSIFTLRTLLLRLGEQQYGFMLLAVSGIGVVTVASQAVTNSSRRAIYAADFANAEDVSNVMAAALTAQAFASVGIVAVLLVVHATLLSQYGSIEGAHLVFAGFSCSALLSTFLAPFSSAIMASGRISLFLPVSIVEILLRVLGLTLFVNFPHPSATAWAGVNLTIVLTVELLTVALVHRFLAINPFRLRFRAKAGVPILLYSRRTILNEIYPMLIGPGMAFSLGLAFGATVNVAVGISFQIRDAMALFLANINAAFAPRIISARAKSLVGESNDTAVVAAKLLVLGFFVCYTPLLLLGPRAVRLISGRVPEHAVEFVQAVPLLVILDMLGTVVLNFAHGAARIARISIWGAVIGAVSFLVSLLIATEMGRPYVFAYVSVMLLSVSLAARLTIASLDCQFASGRFVKQVMLRPMGVLCLLLTLLSLGVREASAAGTIAVATTVPVVAVLMMGFSRHDRHMLFGR